MRRKEETWKPFEEEEEGEGVREEVPVEGWKENHHPVTSFHVSVSVWVTLAHNHFALV